VFNVPFQHKYGYIRVCSLINHKRDNLVAVDVFKEVRRDRS